jgi:hypothetical protein
LFRSDFYRAWLLWVCLGLWHGFACFYVPTLTLASRAAVSVSGSHTTVQQLGTAIMTAILVTVTLRVSGVTGREKDSSSTQHTYPACVLVICVFSMVFEVEGFEVAATLLWSSWEQPS